MRKTMLQKLNILKDKGGFSIVELMLALALLLIALGLGYNLLFFARNSFERSEERWMEQNEVVSVSNVIYDALNESYYVAIVADEASIPSDLDFYGAIFINTSGDTVYKHSDGSNITSTELPGDQLTLLFEQVGYTIGEQPYVYNDLLNMTVKSHDLEYTVQTQVHLDNMTRDRSLHGDSSGPVIVFQTKEIVETVPDDIYDSLCFIATASYGSPTDHSVMLLRRFRDDVLLKTAAGTKFVEFYYRTSPPIAEVIAGSPFLRFITRSALYPVVGVVSLVMNPIHLMSVLAGILLTMIFFRKKKSKLI